MEIVSDAEFENETVILDEREFINCKFSKCILVYSGGNVRFHPGTWLSLDSVFEFHAAAARTIGFIKAVPNLDIYKGRNFRVQ